MVAGETPIDRPACPPNDPARRFAIGPLHRHSPASITALGFCMPEDALRPRRSRQRAVAAEVAARPALYHMFVHDLVVPCRIGIYQVEHDMAQRVRINVDLMVQERPEPRRDSVAGLLNYETIVAGIKALCAAGHVNLVESLAERIAAHCLADRRVAEARVQVEKLDVFVDVAGVGVTLERRR